jgi:hypothetical protein
MITMFTNGTCGDINHVEREQQRIRRKALTSRGESERFSREK